MTRACSDVSEAGIKKEMVHGADRIMFSLHYLDTSQLAIPRLRRLNPERVLSERLLSRHLRDGLRISALPDGSQT